MVVRTISPEEFQRVCDINDIAFAAARKPRDPQAREESEPDEHLNVRAAFDDAGRMMASLFLIPYTVLYEGHATGMGGIGGVATLPEYRRQGSVRALIEQSLREMYERGMVFSALYPFSHAFYRQFGYELTCLRRRLRVQFDAFAGFRGNAADRGMQEASQWLPGDDDAPLRAVYESFVGEANLAARREDAHWKRWLDANPYEKRKYTYLWRDAEGRPSAYAILRVENTPEGMQLHAEDCAFRDPFALRSFFGLLRSMGAAYKQFIWKMPTWIDPNSLFPEPYEAEQCVEQRGMARVVNVGEALRLLRHPQEPGSYALRVRDAQLPQNAGIWRVEFGGGAVSAEKANEKEYHGEADWALDIRAFTQLALGYHNVDTLLWGWPEVGAPSNGDTLRRVFRRRRIYLAEYF